MRVYKPQKIRPWQSTAFVLRALAGLVGIWPVLLLALAVLSPVSPHLRMTYHYVGSASRPRITDCEYLGFRGWLHVDGDCPLVAIIDRRDFE